MLGNGRAECYCYDGVTRLGHIRGKMRKKVWVSAGDIVLVGKRDYQDDKVRADGRRDFRRRGSGAAAAPRAARVGFSRPLCRAF